MEHYFLLTDLAETRYSQLKFSSLVEVKQVTSTQFEKTQKNVRVAQSKATQAFLELQSIANQVFAIQVTKRSDIDGKLRPSNNVYKAKLSLDGRVIQMLENTKTEIPSYQNTHRVSSPKITSCVSLKRLGRTPLLQKSDHQEKVHSARELNNWMSVPRKGKMQLRGSPVLGRRRQFGLHDKNPYFPRLNSRRTKMDL